MFKIWSISLAALILAIAAADAHAQLIDNPDYQAWSRFKAGSMVRMKQESDVGGTKSTMETIETLITIDADHAVVETRTTLTLGAAASTLPAATRSIPSHIGRNDSLPDPNVQLKQSEEEITAAGRKYKCHVLEKTIKGPSDTLKTVVWTSDDIPGGLVKLQTDSQGPHVKISSTQQVVEVVVK